MGFAAGVTMSCFQRERVVRIFDDAVNSTLAVFDRQSIHRSYMSYMSSISASCFLDTSKSRPVAWRHAPVRQEAAFPGRRDVANLSRLLRAPEPLKFTRPAHERHLRFHDDAAQADHLRET